MGQENEITYPSLVFKIQEEFYAIDSRHVSSIVPMPAYRRVPDSAPEILGIFRYRDQVAAVLDLRTLFGMPTLENEYTEFQNMLEQRKNDHIHWVKELERCMECNEEFQLATDPHKCAFGRWYDTYKTDNQVIGFHMRKIDEPHKKLHEAALEVQSCSQECSSCERKECLKSVFDRLKGEYMPKILSILDEAKAIFKAAYHEMVIVLEDGSNTVGLVVDEILSVDQLEDLEDSNTLMPARESNYILGIMQSTKLKGLISLIDDEGLLNVNYDHDSDVSFMAEL